MRITGHSEPQSISGRSRPSVRVAKNHSPMSRMIAPTIREALRPLSDGGGRQAGAVGGGGALGPDDGGGGVALGPWALGPWALGPWALGPWALSGGALVGGSIGVRVVSESVTKPIVRGAIGPGERRAAETTAARIT